MTCNHCKEQATSDQLFVPKDFIGNVSQLVTVKKIGLDSTGKVAYMTAAADLDKVVSVKKQVLSQYLSCGFIV